MNMSTRVLNTLYGRRKLSIDPAKYFAVRIQDGYADPVTREQFLEAVDRVGGTARLLKKLAAAGLRDTSGRVCDSTRNGRIAKAIGTKLADAKQMQSDFDAFVRQLIFSDQHAFFLVEQTRKAIAEAIEAIHAALEKIDRYSENKSLLLTG